MLIVNLSRLYGQEDRSRPLGYFTVTDGGNSLTASFYELGSNPGWAGARFRVHIKNSSGPPSKAATYTVVARAATAIAKKLNRMKEGDQ